MELREGEFVDLDELTGVNLVRLLLLELLLRLLQLRGEGRRGEGGGGGEGRVGIEVLRGGLVVLLLLLELHRRGLLVELWLVRRLGLVGLLDVALLLLRRLELGESRAGVPERIIGHVGRNEAWP